MTRWGWWLSATLCLGCGDPASSPESASLSQGRAKVGDGDCRACHHDAAEQWNASRHRGAFTNPDFQRSYVREPLAFCRDCHAPATVRTSLSSANAEAEGVGCIDCHGGATGAVRTGLGVEGRAVEAPHGLQRDASFGTEACRGCHQFAFPPHSRRPKGTMMQTTMDEHARSAFADRTCARCHFPRRGDGFDHALRSTRDDDAWRRALAVRARRVDDGLAFELEPRGVGHAVPTGDLFRRLALHAEVRDGEAVLEERTRYLGRHFEPWRHPDGTRNDAYAWPVRDDRVVAPTTIVLPLSGAGEAVHWWVDYERVDARDDLDPATSSVASRVRLASGQL